MLIGLAGEQAARASSMSLMGFSADNHTCGDPAHHVPKARLEVSGSGIRLGRGDETGGKQTKEVRRASKSHLRCLSEV